MPTFFLPTKINADFSYRLKPGIEPFFISVQTTYDIAFPLQYVFFSLADLDAGFQAGSEPPSHSLQNPHYLDTQTKHSSLADGKCFKVEERILIIEIIIIQSLPLLDRLSNRPPSFRGRWKNQRFKMK